MNCKQTEERKNRLEEIRKQWKATKKVYGIDDQDFSAITAFLLFEIDNLQLSLDRRDEALRPFTEAGRFLSETPDKNERLLVWRRLDSGKLKQFSTTNLLKACEALGLDKKEEKG